MELMRTAGAKYLRFDFFWYNAEPVRNEFDWSVPDRIVNAALAHGLEPILIPRGAPQWANGNHTDTIDNPCYPPLNGDDFRQFLYKAAKRYIPRGVTVYEIWNEANMSTFWQNPDPLSYTRTVLIPGARGLRDAAHELGTNVTILTGGSASVPTGSGDYSPVDFLKGIYAAGGRGSFDAVATHPYCWPFSADCYGLTQAAGLARVMRENGDDGKKIWATEVGAPTGGHRAVSHSEQASIVTDVIRRWFSLSYAGPLIWFTARDLHTGSGIEDENFGLWQTDFTLKQAYFSFRRALR